MIIPDLAAKRSVTTYEQGLKGLMVLSFFLLVFPDVHGAGQTAGQFLKLPVSARASAMAAFGAVASDTSAVFYNPAGLSQLSQNELSASYMKYFDGAQAGSLGLGIPLPEHGTAGLGITYFTVSDMERRDRSETYSGSFGSAHFSAAFSFARKLLDFMSLGLSLKAVQETLDDKSAAGLAVDIGALLWDRGTRLSLAVGVQNAGTGLKYLKEADPFPLDLKIGAAYWPVHGLIFSVERDHYVLEDRQYTSAGGEYWITRQLAARLGYRWGVDVQSMAGFTGGLGFKVGPTSLDYAAGSAKDLGGLHRVTLGVVF
jgi:hypothetical protein